jgi:hypothetical protein
MQGVPQSERENEYLNPCDPLAKVVTDDIQGVSQSKKENEAPNLGVKVSKMVGKDMKLVPQSDKVTTRGALQNQLTAQTSQVVKPDEHDLRSLFEEAPATAVPKPFVDSVWDGVRCPSLVAPGSVAN